VRPIARRFSDRTKSGVSQNIVAITLLLLLLSSWLTELIGIHALFGAFMFGAIVPKEGGFARHLAEKMEDLVVVFLLPLFFAFSGLRTQIGLLDRPGLWAICALILAVACVGKFGGSAIAARLTGLGWRDATAIGILMNTRGLVELVVLNIGYDLGILSPTMFTMMVIMALVTTFMTTPLLHWVYPIEELSKELAEPDEEQKPSVAPPYTVLTCVSFERSGPPLVTLGAALTGKNADRGRLYALRLVRPSEGSSFVLEQSETGPRMEMNDEAVLGPVLERARELAVRVRPISFVSAEPGSDICDVARAKHADLVLLGWHKSMLGRTMLSGTVHDVMANTQADVGVLIDRGLSQLKSILVPFLGSDHDRAALRLARRIAENEGARVTILHVVRPDRHFDVRQEVDQVFDEPHVGGRSTTVELKLVQNPVPAEAVISAASAYDLVLIGVGREWGLEHSAFGMQSEDVLRRSPKSVLVVRQGDAQARAQAVEKPAAKKAEDTRLATLPVR